MTRNLSTTRWFQTAAGAATLGVGLLSATPAAAEVTVTKGDTWDVYVAGRVSAFVSTAIGDGYPVAAGTAAIEPGGGIDVAKRSTKAATDATGMADPTKQGKLFRMRLRSGYYPNILTLGLHKRFGQTLKLTSQMSMWGEIESDDVKGTVPLTAPANGTRDNGIKADFREGYLQLDDRWGQLRGGRFMSPFSRGLNEIDALYGHGYGAGFPVVSRGLGNDVTGDLISPGPMGGMTGFGVLSATYSSGATYTTPNLGGVRLALGLFDAASFVSSGWSTSRIVRPEAEATYDLRSGGFTLHVFGSGGFQKLNNGNSPQSTSVWGASYGARVEVGPVRLGGGGFLGKGAGVNHACDDNTALASPATMPNKVFRPVRGFVGILQLVFGQFDVNGGFGQTQIDQLPEDKASAMTLSTLKSQTGVFGGVVYHLNESFHLDADVINGAYKWANGESQKLTVINAGVTLTF